MRVRQLLAAVAVLLVASTVGSGTAPARADAYPPAGLRVVAGSATPATVVTGASSTFSGGGFARATLLRVSVDGTQVMQLQSSARGDFSVSVPLTGTGNKALATSGVEAGGRLRVVTAQVRVVTATFGGLPHTGSDRTMPSLLIGFALVAAGAALVLASRARGHRRAVANT